MSCRKHLYNYNKCNINLLYIFEPKELRSRYSIFEVDYNFDFNWLCCVFHYIWQGLDWPKWKGVLVASDLVCWSLRVTALKMSEQQHLVILIITY